MQFFIENRQNKAEMPVFCLKWPILSQNTLISTKIVRVYPGILVEISVFWLKLVILGRNGYIFGLF